ncbi:UDP-3-O-acylglucosamine N-acyltransferase [Pigmentiphaga litoralis]|uniref:UDP-3-O-(3-hydroxymyristoyl)glucosamine N-acyltransferase n=1 Tax=Pigmentiphaga litoralis TaxID=516702 RepID=UPI00167B5972|nr:UDP-3-O-(3-hydroxymyristoyl)glucosamine N-acyltransferase [Pigmentiphaga litoralis]GGX02466.1 UDP-3-O-acylglucosamine N-acyltransferase [Pigmentiphaga litoralis]
MPILLAPADAPALAELLEATDTSGLTWHLEDLTGGAAASTPDAAGASARSASLADLRVAGIGTLGAAGPTEIAFLSNPRYQSQLDSTHAGAVILSPAMADAHKASLAASGRTDGPRALVVCTEPYLLYARVGQWFARRSRANDIAGIHPSAVISPDAVIGDGVTIGPLAVIEAGVTIGQGARIGAGCIIGKDCAIGEHSLLHPRVTLYDRIRIGARALIHSGAVIGADGFGFAPDSHTVKGAYSKIEHFGGVMIGDDVEIGANTTIDRGVLDDTVIGNGVKLDDQIMVAHNVRIGDHTAIAACTGIAGSTTIGQRVAIGGAAMIGGHIDIGDDVFLTASTVVFSNLAAGGRYTGIMPAVEHSEWERNAVAMRHLGRLQRRLKALEKLSAKAADT